MLLVVIGERVSERSPHTDNAMGSPLSASVATSKQATKQMIGWSRVWMRLRTESGSFQSETIADAMKDADTCFVVSVISGSKYDPRVSLFKGITF
jgi:hypothetical protein